MNIIVKFNSVEAQEEFLRRAKSSHPQLLEKSYATKRRPDLILESLPKEDRSIVDELVDGLGKVYEDVKFETMEEPR